MNANWEDISERTNGVEKNLEHASNELVLLAQCLREVQRFADGIEKDLKEDSGMKETQSEDSVHRMDIVDNRALEEKDKDADVDAQKK